MSGSHSVSIAAKNGPLAQIWLAANMSNLGRGQVLQTSISESADEIAKVSGCDNNVSNVEHITLRISGELLQGIVRVYSKQAAFLLSDIKDTLTKISTLFKANHRAIVTVNKANTIATMDQLILEDAVTEKEVLAAPGLEFLEENEIPEGLLGSTAEMTQRRVQGAAPWDASVEFGRRFDPDDDLENNQSSGIDLDFDIDDGQLSKDIEEGTRQNMSHDGEPRGSHVLDSQEPDHLIGDDDFTLEDPNSVDWDLGITDHDDRDKHSETGSQDSVEVGRRADERSITEEPIDFGFNLDIEKDDGEEQDQQEGSLSQAPRAKQQSEEALEDNSRNVNKNPALRNCTKIQQDSETELDDSELKSGLVDRQQRGTAVSVIKPLRLTQKRIWEEMAHSLSYLPEEAMERLLPLQTLKRPKPQQEENDKFIQPNLNISLGLSDDLLQETSLSTSLPPSEPGEDDHDVPMDADIGDQSLDQVDVTSHENLLVRQSTQQESDALESSSQYSEQNNSQKIKLSTGEVVSKETVDFAELLRTEFIDNGSLVFNKLLAARRRLQQSAENLPVTRQEATRGFFDLLSLATSDCIDLDQKETFGDINITPRPSLYERFISA
ncbi:MCD1 (YDL003W) [Zygosaccharomyces parabailii]|nr:MCD1 (YDL003W) [Zygosaccharomyces parabailii]CDH10325.1 related to Sister chromatid cohesion protein 1 [Zygosaccharomyces bailii ISA1307]